MIEYFKNVGLFNDVGYYKINTPIKILLKLHNK